MHSLINLQEPIKPRIYLLLIIGLLAGLHQAGAQAPAITTQPVSQNIVYGQNAAFNVATTGAGPFKYQWLFNGTNLPNGIITTVAGNGNASFSGDGGAATNASLNAPWGMAFDATGNFYIADRINDRIRKVDTNGIITTVAGNNSLYTSSGNYSGDGGAATNTSLDSPIALVFDAAGNFYISDRYNARVRKVATNGIITTVAGKGINAYSGDGGAANNAGIFYPLGIVFDTSGNLYFADYNNQRIRRVDTNGIITTVAGKGPTGFGTGSYSGDGGAATNANLHAPSGLAFDALGKLYITDQFNNRIRKMDTNGIITTAAGNGINTYVGDGGAATNASLDNPEGVAFDISGNLYIADSLNGRIRKVDTNGIITTVAGNGINAYAGDGGAATNASLDNPSSLICDASGNLYIADSANNRIREVHFAGFPTLALTNISAAKAGNYKVIITGPYSSVTSSVVALKVVLPPITPVFAPDTGTFNLAWSAVSNLTYQLQYNLNLSSTNWINLGSPITATNNSVSTTDMTSSNAQRFYRVLLVQ